MKKIILLLTGVICGFIFEVLNLTEFYDFLFPKNYINANADLFLFIFPLILISAIIVFIFLIKKYHWLWYWFGFLGGFLMGIVGFITLLGIGGGV